MRWFCNQAAVDYALGVAATEEEEAAPGGLRRIVFDEGHHLFDAADSAFSGHLTALETAELRRWLRGPETERRRGRGLADRIGDLVADNETAEKLVQKVLQAAYALPGPGWTQADAGGNAGRRGGTFSFPGAPAGVGAGRAECRPVASKPIACRWLMGWRRRRKSWPPLCIDLKRPMTKLAEALGQEAR